MGLGRRQAGRIIPAYAGSTSESISRGPGGGDHPRIRGEHSQAAAIEATAPGSSPHTRGAPSVVQVHAVGGGIIPAYAGSTLRGAGPRCRRRDHPRIRGEHRYILVGDWLLQGSSPHTRGAPRTSPTGSGPLRIIPAYAGSTETLVWLLGNVFWIIPAYAGSTWTFKQA